MFAIPSHVVAIGLLVPPLLAGPSAERHARSPQSADERAIARFVDATRDYVAFGKSGSIFTPDVAEVLRFRLRVTRWLYRYNPVETLTDPVPAKHLKPQPAPFVLDALPPLPHRLEYRLHGRHLLLVDRQTRALVDVLDDAVAR